MKPAKPRHPIAGFIWGSILLIIGTVATVASYTLASDGSRFSIWYGAVLVGLVRIVVSIVQVGLGDKTTVDAGGNVRQKKTRGEPIPEPASYYAQYTAPIAPVKPGMVRPAYTLPAQPKGNGGLVLGLSAIGAVLVLIAGFAFYNVLTSQNLFANAARITGINRVAAPDFAHTNTAALTRPAYATKGTSNTMPVDLAVQGYLNLGNGIAAQPEPDYTAGCLLYKDGCFRYDYTQFNASCPNGVAFTIEGFVKGASIGTTVISVGPMMHSVNQTGALEFDGKIGDQYADGVTIASAACA